MQARVNLPPGALIEYHSFCKAIAQAAYPVRGQGLEGIDCIIGKVAKPLTFTVPTGSGDWSHLAGLQSVLVPEDDCTLEHLPADRQSVGTGGTLEPPLVGAARQNAVFEFAPTYDLTDGERRSLEEILPQLPPLRYPMSDDDTKAFMNAYMKLPNRPAWTPVLMTAEVVAKQRGLQEQHFDNVLQTLREEFASGRLVACTQSGLPVKAMSLRCFIPRQSAIAYLDRYGIAYHEDVSCGTMVQPSTPVNVGSVAIPKSDGSEAVEANDASEFVQAGADDSELGQSQEKAAAPENTAPVSHEAFEEQELVLPPADPVRTKTSGTNPGAAKPKLTYKQKNQIVAFYRRLKKKGVHDYAKQTAEKFGITTRHVSNVVKEIEEAEEAKRAKQAAPGRIYKQG